MTMWRLLAVSATFALLSACDGIGDDPPAPSAASASPAAAAAAPAAPSRPVAFVRRETRACPGTEGGEMWFAELRGHQAIRVTYGVRFNGEDDGRRDTLSLAPRIAEEVRLMCAGDGNVMRFEPFVVDVEYID